MSKVVRPFSPTKRIVLSVVVVVVLAFLPTCATMGVAPVGTRLAAPLVCPSGTARSEVVSRWGGGSKGGKSLKWDLYCLTAEGLGTVPSTAKLFFGVFGIWLAIMTVLALILRVLGFLAARGRREGAVDAA